ncbi:dual specificity protein phosphatase [Angomonas deanei]|uniref:Uncharacterized protein n=1 Tax=Angomonas deanei TaxID=59799 RepID=A0A7G2CRY4_9TRYP|nr:dual specificity protein phosphatase [Angomonas deanei]CAD2220952.1 hypothetical protein, conserved [Angomonas deanei]|eukprot:EPY29451.1 dual specificity protein phosphatase [Angomonas deanei]
MAHPDVSIKPHFLRQLRTFAKKHQVEHDVFDKAVNDSEFGLDNDQWMLRNTLLNGLAFEEQQANELYKQCSQKIDVGSRRGKKKAAHISFVDTNKGTDVSSLTTTPVINVMPVHHMDPNAKTPGFTGSQGPVALRSGRTSPSILSRSTSPCAHRLESDPKTNPKGRQELALIPGAANPPVETKQITGSSAKPSAERNPSLNTIPVSIRPAAKEGSEEKQSADYARLAPPVHRSQFTLKSGNKYRNGSPLPIQGKKSTIKKRKASPATRSSSAGPKSPRGSNASGAPEPKKTIQRSAPSSYKGIAPSRTIKADTSSTASADGRAPATVTRPRSASARSGSAKAKDRTSSPGAKKSKSRTGSPAAEPRTSKPTTTKLTKSGSTSSLNSADTNNSPSRRTVTSTPNAPSTVSRQLPAVISSRRKTT